MSDSNHIPMVNIFGPGSQPEDQEGTLEYMTMPTEMSTFDVPSLPEVETLGDVSGVISFLEQVTQALETYQGTGSEQQFDLSALEPNELGLVNQILGVGEVSITIDGPSPVEIQESVMAGLWRVHHLDANGKLIKDLLEVALIPSAVRQLAFQSAAKAVNADVDGIEGLINSPAVLVELDDKAKHYQVGDATHVVNLSLLPLSPEDVQLIGMRLGVGPATILSRGYGNCRIGSTAVDSVWWIKYFNSEDALILNTIEVIDIPEVAMASVEDIEDSAHRLKEILEIYL